MVISASVAAKLREYPICDLNPCKWRKVYDYPIDEKHILDLLSRFSVLPDGFEDWLETLMTKPDERALGIQYFEVIAPLLQRISDKFQCDTTVELPSPAYEDLPPLRTTASMHNAFPIIKWTPYYLLAESVYRVLEPHISDPAMFRVHPFDLNG